jgi:hypothetical protein
MNQPANPGSSQPFRAADDPRPAVVAPATTWQSKAVSPAHPSEGVY